MEKAALKRKMACEIKLKMKNSKKQPSNIMMYNPSFILFNILFQKGTTYQGKTQNITFDDWISGQRILMNDDNSIQFHYLWTILSFDWSSNSQ